MKQKRRHKIALFFLLVYVPVAMSVSFFHSHSLPTPAEKQQISTQDAQEFSIAKADLLCVICKFLSSHSSILDTNSRASFDFNSIGIAPYSTDFSPITILLLSDRAPPFFA